jgi:D-alanyl-D-alanine carboxypeptidase (penicillin-binding protein 5/6)
MKKIWKIMTAGMLVLAVTGCRQDTAVLEPEETYAAPEDFPDLFCDYYYLEDSETGQVILDHRSEEQIFPASMTKMMTAILAIERIPDPENTVIPFTEEMLAGLVEANANRAGFVPGDEPTALDYIYGDLLPSGADCSRALAFYLAGSEEAFVEQMNAKAAELGMQDTHFVNTTGLHEDDHYSTCRDMAVLLNYCMQNELFRTVITTEIWRTEPLAHYRRGLLMQNYVLLYINQEDPPFSYEFDIPGFIGGKSGYTIEGQYTLASCAEINDIPLTMVNAHGYHIEHYPASISDAAALYHWFSEHYEPKEAVSAGQDFGPLKVRESTEGDIRVLVSDSLTLDLPEEENVHYKVILPDSVTAPVAEGETVGTLEIYAYDTLAGTVNLVSAESRTRTAGGVLYTFAEERIIPELPGILAVLALMIAVIFMLKREHPGKPHS